MVFDLSLNNTLEFQKMMMDLATNELTAHGVMLFAVLSPSFIFLRIINDNYYTRKKEHCEVKDIHKFIFWFCLNILLGLDLYIIKRLLVWARVLHETVTFDFMSVNVTSFEKFLNQVMKNAHDYYSRYFLGDIIIFKGEFPYIFTIILLMTISSLISILLLYSLNIVKCGVTNTILLCSVISTSYYIIMMELEKDILIWFTPIIYIVIFIIFEHGRVRSLF